MGAVADSVVRAVTEGLLPRGAGVLAACSGGADSVALAVAAAEHPDLRVALGHVDHGLRPESRDEAEQVRDLARRLGVPFHLERLSGLDVRSAGLEGAARVARYAALARLAAQAGATLVATAHTRRDQAETLLLRLLRGAGPGALSGVRRSRPLTSGIELVRPLLGVSRADTEAFCGERGLSFTDDPHNADPARTRARLRRLWPLLLELNPRIEEALAGAAESLAAEDELLSSMLPDDLRLETLRDLPAPLFYRAVLRAAAQAGAHPERQHLKELRKLVARGGGSLDVPGGRARLADGELRFVPPQPAEAEAPGAAELAIPGPGSYAWRSRELAIAAGSAEGTPVDVTRAPFPWTLRGHRPGDRFRPAGGRTKKVADLWIDAGVPREARRELALLADAAGRVFWVEGLREGEPSRGAMSYMVAFRIRPEMKPRGRTLGLRRQSESRSATMGTRPDEEPR